MAYLPVPWSPWLGYVWLLGEGAAASVDFYLQPASNGSLEPVVVGSVDRLVLLSLGWLRKQIRASNRLPHNYYAYFPQDTHFGTKSHQRGSVQLGSPISAGCNARTRAGLCSLLPSQHQRIPFA